MFDLGRHANSFSESGQLVISRAIEDSSQRNHNFLSVEHVLIALKEVEAEVFNCIMLSIGLAADSVSTLFEENLSQALSKPGKRSSVLKATENLFDRSIELARQEGRHKIDALDLFVAVFADLAGVPASILRSLGIASNQPFDAITECIRARKELVKEQSLETESVETQPVQEEEEEAVQTSEPKVENEYNDAEGTQEVIPTTLEGRIRASGMPEEASTTALIELQRMRQLTAAFEQAGMISEQGGMIKNYLDWLLALPWKASSEENWKLSDAERVLNKDHFGLERVKERILEYLSVQKLLRKPTGSILCLVGPPGVGKTSLGYSIASALGRKFVRLSLGGVRDETVIRGHRRTYANALPGQIIRMIRGAETKNPVFLLDELDKLSQDTLYGNPSAALLEVLDPEQNRVFRDHYLDVPFDLSDVMFIGTCNQTDTIPAVLRDRLEIIRLPGYTDEEKLQIALRHLVRKKLDMTGLKEDQVRFTEAGLSRIIREYTQEEGVRMLERRIEAICRKIARRLVTASESNDEAVRAESEAHQVMVDEANVDSFLATEQSRQVVIEGQSQAIAALDHHVVGQAEAKRDVVAAATLHYGAANRGEGGKNPGGLTGSVLLVGPAGVGKTLLVQSLAQYLKVPFVALDAVQLAAARYPYSPGQLLLRMLLQTANHKVDRVRNGVVSLQRMDRLMQHGCGEETASLAQMQEAILHVVSGEEVDLQTTQGGQQQTITLDTRQLLFFCEATFPSIGQLYDLLDHGLLPELAACFGTIVRLNEVSPVDFLQLLKPDSPIGLIARYQQLLKTQGIEVEFVEEGLQEVAKVAFERKNGVRGAEQILRDLCTYLLCDVQATGPVAVSKDLLGKVLAREKERNRHILMPGRKTPEPAA